MKLQDRIDSFSKLGEILSDYLSANDSGTIKNKIDQQLALAEIENPWFTNANIHFAFNNIANQLGCDHLNEWIKQYPEIQDHKEPKTIGVVSAGNIPLVVFHDLLSILISGNRVNLKLSSKDKVLVKLIIEILGDIDNEFKKLITISEGILKDFDAIIATGSDNSARYFEYYFGKYPNIIRKNRTSVAILDGDETRDELRLLADDIYKYFGLGCRNVSKIMLPKSYDITKMLDEFNHYNDLRNHNKFANNYTYNKSIYLMNNIHHLDNGFSLFKQDEGLSSPISVIYFDYYENSHNLYNYLKENKLMIQCMVGKNTSFRQQIKFGETQKPNLWDYADDVDTLKFLLSLN